MRTKPADVARLVKGIGAMHESSTYQAILEEGRRMGLEEARREAHEIGFRMGRLWMGRRLLLRLGTRLLGPPDDEVKDRVEAIDDPDLIADLHDRTLDVDSWDALFATLERDA